jgi:hypothetical protein
MGLGGRGSKDKLATVHWLLWRLTLPSVSANGDVCVQLPPLVIGTNFRQRELDMGERRLKMNMPGFSADMSLYKPRTSYVTPHQPAREDRALQGVKPAVIVQGSDGSFYSCEPTSFEGSITYWDCRKLLSNFKIGNSYCRTDKECVLTSMWCNDRCIDSSGHEETSGWYPCGVCLDLPLPEPF